MTQVQNDLTKKYSLTTRITHWLTVLGVFALIPLGIKMHEMEVSAEKLWLFQIHTMIGIFILLLTLFRAYLYFKHDRPPHLKTGNNFNNKLIVWIHNAFYFVVILMTTSGLAINASTGLFDVYKSGDITQFPADIEVIQAEVHEILYFVLALLIILHVAGVLKHILLNKENILKRMF
jgi:cytochrome b561